MIRLEGAAGRLQAMAELATALAQESRGCRVEWNEKDEGDEDEEVEVVVVRGRLPR